MNKNCTIYLVRHGQTDWNVNKLIQGQHDIPLNKVGEDQAKVAGARLKNIHFDAVFSSDLIRAKRTAELIMLERKLAVETTKALRERYFGKYQGQSFARQGNIKAMIKKLDEININSADFDNEIETDEQIIFRLITFLREIAIAYSGKTVLMVSHGGPLRTLLIHLGWGSRDNLAEGGITNTSYIKLESDGVDFFIRETFGIKKKE